MNALSRIAWVLMWTFVFSIPWEKSVWTGDAGTLARVIGISAFVAGAACAARRPSALRPNAVLIAATVFVAWASMTWFWSVDRHATYQRSLTLAQLLAMVWLIWDQCRGQARQLQLLEAYLLGAVAASGFAFWRYAHNTQTYYRRYAAAGFDPNDFGLVLAISIPIGLYLFMCARGVLRWVWLAAAGVTMGAMILTASRAALVATFVAFTFILWTWRRADMGHRIGAAALLLVLVLSVVRFAPAPQRQRLVTVAREATQGTFHDRTRIWKSGLKVFKHHPILGIGAGAYPEAVSPWLGRSTVRGFQFVAHNTFLSVLVECGLVGFAIYGCMFAGIFAFLWAMAPPERALWGCVLAAWAAGAFTLTWEHYKPSWLIIALIMTHWRLAYRPSDKNG